MIHVTDDGKGHIGIFCECGKPIVVSTEDGMFCEDRCGEAESKSARVDANILIGMFLPPKEEP